MKKFNNLIIDGNNLSMRVLTSIPAYGSQFKSGHQDGLFVHSFFNSLFSIFKQFEFDNIIICFDSKINKRKKLYPEYKANRKPKTEEDIKDRKNYYDLIDILKENLVKLGPWACRENEGYEADDLIAHIINISEYDESFLIVSSDADLYQLLSDRVLMYLPHKRRLYTKLDFKNEYKINPSKWARVKALAGDVGDNIKGINKVGIKTAIKMINTKRCWMSFVEEYRDVDLETNLELIKLPFDDKISLWKISKSYFDFDEWSELFQEFSLSKLNINDFKEIFS